MLAIRYAGKLDSTKYAQASWLGRFYCYDSLSSIYFRGGDYKASVENAVNAAEYEKLSKRNDEMIYVRMVLAYIFNKQYDEAVPVYREHKDKPVGKVKFSEYVLSQMKKKPGMTVEEFEKIKERLEQ